MSDLVVMAEDAAPLKISSGAIKLGIRASYSNGYQTFFEVGNDTGTRVNRHADAVAIGIWPSTGHTVHGFEVKVSRTDFLNEMKDPSKSQAIFRFCHRWSLATPPGLVRVDELPPNWGLVTFDGKTLRTVKQAPMLTPEPLTPGFVAALVRRAGEIDAGLLAEAERKGKLAAEAERKGKLAAEANFKSSLESKARDFGHRQSNDAKEAIEFLGSIRAAFGEEFMTVHSVPDIVAAYKIVKRAGFSRNWGSIVKVLNSLDRAGEDIRKAIAEAGVDVPDRKVKGKR